MAEVEQISETELFDLSKRRTRREFLRAFGIGVVSVTAAYLYAEVEPVLGLLIAEDIQNDSSVRATTDYSSADLAETKTFVIGDSNGVGYDPAGKRISTAQMKAEKINSKLGSDWKVQVEAHEGDNLDDTEKQLDRIREDILKCTSNVDIDMSAGANNLMEANADENSQKKIKELEQNPFNTDIFPLA